MGRYDDPNSATTSFSVLLGDAPHLDEKARRTRERTEHGTERADRRRAKRPPACSPCAAGERASRAAFIRRTAALVFPCVFGSGGPPVYAPVSVLLASSRPTLLLPPPYSPPPRSTACSASSPPGGTSFRRWRRRATIPAKPALLDSPPSQPRTPLLGPARAPADVASCRRVTALPHFRHVPPLLFFLIQLNPISPPGGDPPRGDLRDAQGAHRDHIHVRLQHPRRRGKRAQAPASPASPGRTPARPPAVRPRPGRDSQLRAPPGARFSVRTASPASDFRFGNFTLSRSPLLL